MGNIPTASGTACVPLGWVIRFPASPAPGLSPGPSWGLASQGLNLHPLMIGVSSPCVVGGQHPAPPPTSSTSSGRPHVQPCSNTRLGHVHLLARLCPGSAARPIRLTHPRDRPSLCSVPRDLFFTFGVPRSPRGHSAACLSYSTWPCDRDPPLRYSAPCDLVVAVTSPALLRWISVPPPSGVFRVHVPGVPSSHSAWFPQFFSLGHSSLSSILGSLQLLASAIGLVEIGVAIALSPLPLTSRTRSAIAFGSFLIVIELHGVPTRAPGHAAEWWSTEHLGHGTSPRPPVASPRWNTPILPRRLESRDHFAQGSLMSSPLRLPAGSSGGWPCGPLLHRLGLDLERHSSCPRRGSCRDQRGFTSHR